MNSHNSVKPFIFYSDKLNFKTTDGAKGKEYWVEGYVSTGDLDLVNDIVTKNCMDSMTSQFSMRTIKLDFDHEAFRGDTLIEQESSKRKIPLGKAINCDRDSKGVKVSWKLNSTWKKFNEKGDVVMDFNELWSNVEEGYYDAFSIAYVPTKTAMIEREGKTIRLLDDLNLLNVALTGNPINPGASMTSVMAKSLAFMKGQETKDDGWKDPADLSLFEVKGKIDKLSTEISGLKKQMRCKSMGDKTDEQLKAEEDAKIVADAKAIVDAKAAEDAQAKADADAKAIVDAKATEDAEAKSKVDLKSRIDKLETDMKAVQKENTEMKAVLEKAQHKSLGGENNEGKSGQNSAPAMVGPLDMI